MKKNNLTLSDFKNSVVWSYTRVSTKDQFVNNGSIETQVNKIKARGGEVVFVRTPSSGPPASCASPAPSWGAGSPCASRMTAPA